MIERRRLDITGLVQGVGFRPFVHRLAHACSLCGWIANDAHGVRVEVQGEALRIGEFMQRLQQEKPLHASIYSLASVLIPLREESGFIIRESEGEGEGEGGAAPSAIVLPDLAPCEDCLQELFDPADRRYRYPFTNCTHCGPRFSIVERLPYDRANTAMKNFPLCQQCRREYTDPQDRRFHAEPNACPGCGPQLQLRDLRGKVIALRESALQQAVAAIDAGRIVALKGVGGFQLLADAANTNALRRLRDRKQRPHKPFALLYPDIETVRRDCEITMREETLLCAQQRPILLLPAKGGDSASAAVRVSEQVAPKNPNLGVMLPASPLHHLLMESLGRPVVATSGNLAGEPICIDNDEALARLGNIADLFLLHDRRILRPLDDSVLRAMDGRPAMLRRARGYVPLPLQLPNATAADGDLLALGADLKNCVALARGDTVYPGQHIGDLENRVALETFEQSIGDLQDFYRFSPETIICDLHPGYASSRWAEKNKLRRICVQHHLAHFFSCMAEHTYRGPALGICWDGTGYGEDGTVRGGEFLHWNGGTEVKHSASLRAFPLPGGERAVREPPRSAAGILYEALGHEAFAQSLLHNYFNSGELKTLARMLERNINSPRCTSAGRLFDAIAALLGLVTEISFEGQAAMAVEYAAQESDIAASYPFGLDRRDGRWILDWVPAVAALMEESRKGISMAGRAAAFHNTLAQMILSVAQKTGEEHVFLSGGVFQNKRLVETSAALLRKNDFRVYCHSVVPPNDGGIALGQIYYARCMAACGLQVGESRAQCV